MAAKKKSKPARKAKKKAAPKRRRAAKVKTPRAAAPPAGLQTLDSEWRSFIRKSVPDEPLTEVWEAPKGVASAKTTIRLATKKKAKKKAAKKKAAKKKAGARKAPARRRAKKK
ncbi:MAG TPA: hypothetical protein VHP37_27645 [Burkholderiales bacterium]|nr:hypothetical protein [Burkholderiales bacterium]